MTDEKRDRLTKRLEFLIRRAHDALAAERHSECFAATRDAQEVIKILYGATDDTVPLENMRYTCGCPVVGGGGGDSHEHPTISICPTHLVP